MAKLLIIALAASASAFNFGAKKGAAKPAQQSNRAQGLVRLLCRYSSAGCF